MFSFSFTNPITQFQVNGQEPAFAKFFVYVNNTGGGNAKPSDFTIYTGGTPSSITGSSNGVIVSYMPSKDLSIYIQNPIINSVPYGMQISGDCQKSGNYNVKLDVNPGDKKNCFLTMMYPNF